MTARATVAPSSTLLRIDDSSSELQYSGEWSQAGNSLDYQSTSHASSSVGSSVKFTFNGTYITVYGSVGANGSTSSYTLDDASPVSKSVQPVVPPQYNWPFFFPESPLQPGLHELVIAVEGGTFNLDYIEYTGFPSEDSNGDGSSPAGSPASSSSDSAPVASSSSSKGKGLPTGAIAGIAVVAAVVVLAVVAAVFLVVRRRSARKVRHQSRVPEKGIDILVDGKPQVQAVARAPPPSESSTATPGVFRRLSRIYRPTPAKSAQSSKTATSSAPTSITQSSAMFTSVIMLSPALSMVSEEASLHDLSSTSRITA
ncbi:hypothetical protein FKP32DRAFT_1612768 [Trametes sanguinea]|nr:hypothetical protein FKP32DRAFT_1612768 [Trametes sanguinea]